MVRLRRAVPLGLLLLSACSGGGSGVGDVGTGDEAASFRFLTAGERDPRPFDGLGQGSFANAADLDGDGHVDLVVQRDNGVARLFWGALQPARPVVTELALGVIGEFGAALDLDRDGDLDLLLPVADASPFGVFLQTAERQFERQPAPVLPTRTVTALAVADVNGDGVDDVLAACTTANLVLLGDGVGGLVDASAGLPLDLRESSTVAVGELAGGPGADLVFAGPQGLAILRNDGTAFADVTLAVVASTTAAAAVEIAEAVDVDGDGLVDLLLGDASSMRWLRNDGAGALATAQVLSGVFGRGFASADRDGDGDLDLAVARGNLGLAMYDYDAASAQLAAAPSGLVPPDVGTVHRVGAFDDLDGNGRPDLLLMPRAGVLWNVPGSASLVLDERRRLPAYEPGYAGSAFGNSLDVDVDGDVDIIASSSGTIGTVTRLFRNDGSGSFTEQAWGLEVPVAIVDVDADGNGDLLHAGGWLAGDGQGNYGAGAAWPQGTSYLGVGDFDGDGVDEVIVRGNGIVTVLEPSAPAPQPATSLQLGAATVLAIGDVDGDGVDDLVVGGDELLLLRGDAGGGFVDASAMLPVVPGSLVAALVVDWDGDGDNDLIAARSLVTEPNVYARVLRNDGPFGFTLAGELVSDQPAPLGVDGISAADVDEDGRAEVFVLVQLSNFLHAPDQARLEAFEAVDAGGAVRRVAAGPAGLVDAAPFAAKGPWLGSFAPRFVDLDGDGDLDLSGTRVRINGLRDLTLQARSRWGGALEVTVADRAAPGASSAVVLLGVTPTRNVVPGLGTLLVDPATAIVAAVDLTDEGEAIATFALPSITLPGALPLYAQALLLDGGGNVRHVTTRERALVW